MLPIQLIPYFQYTVKAVIGSLFFGLSYWQRGQRGFYGASLEVDPESFVTSWLIRVWLGSVLLGFRRAHGELRRVFNLDKIRTSEPWGEVGVYFSAFGLGQNSEWSALLMDLLYRYSRETGQFLFGVPSQYRDALRL